MGVEAVIGGLFGLAGAGISAVSASHAQSAQASAQADLNEKTMAFNQKEAQKARDFTASQAVVDRKYNTAEALAARSFTAAQAKQMMDFNAKESQIGRTFNAQQSLLARQFEERMSSSAHQREVQDLRAAGLNPILSATGGNGASSPVAPILASPTASASLGSSAQASHSGSGAAAASVGALQALRKGNIMGEFMSSALSLVKANAELKHAEAADKSSDASLKQAEVAEARQKVDEKFVNQQIENLKKDNVFKDWQIKSEQEKVNLVKQEILKCAKEIESLERVTAAREKEAAAIAYQAVKNADTEAAYKATLGRMAEAHNDNEREQLKQKAQELKFKFEEGQNGLERDWIKKHPYWAHTLVTVDKVMSAVSPIKLRPLQSD